MSEALRRWRQLIVASAAKRRHIRSRGRKPPGCVMVVVEPRSGGTALSISGSEYLLLLVICIMLKAIRQSWYRSKFARACGAGDLDAAVVAGRAILADAPDDFQVQNDIGAALLDAEQFVEAEGCFRRANELKEHAVHVNNLGRALLAQRRFEHASEAFRRAAQLDPSDPQPRYNSVVVLREQGNTDAAAAALDQFVRDFPAHAGGQNDLGCMLEERGDTAGALAAFLRAVELSPGYVPACLNGIRLLCSGGQYPRATPLLKRLAAAGMHVRVNANDEQVEIDIDGKPFYRGPVRRSEPGQAAAE